MVAVVMAVVMAVVVVMFHYLGAGEVLVLWCRGSIHPVAFAL